VPDLPWVQISFNVRRPWLMFAVDEHGITEAKRAGWQVCHSTNGDWDGYTIRLANFLGFGMITTRSGSLKSRCQSRALLAMSRQCIPTDEQVIDAVSVE